MFASRALKPKLSLNISTIPHTTSTSTTTTTKRPMLSLAIKSPITPTAMAPLRSPMTPVPSAPLRSPIPLSPLPQSPTSRNTKINARGYCTAAPQQPSYTYTNNFTSSRSILKKQSQTVSSAAATANTSRRRVAQLQFCESPVVYSVSPIEDPEYYGGYTKMTREERRWMVRA